jgi:uncharacterized protein (DUF302 family)
MTLAAEQESRREAMAAEPTTTVFSIAEPYEKALKLLRETFGKEGLGIPMELDLSARIRRSLGISLAPCRVLFVDCPLLVLQAVALDASAATMLPLHVVVSGSGPRTLVHWREPASARGAGLPAEVRAPIRRLQSRLSDAVGRIGIRQRHQLTC